MDDLSAALGAARAALMQGDKTAARAAVARVLRADPGNAEAWLLLSGIVATPAQQRECLGRVLALDPANAAARRGLAALDAAAAPASLAAAFSPPPAPAAAAAQVRPLAARAADPGQSPSGLRRLAGASTPPDPAGAYLPSAPADSAVGPGRPQPPAPSAGMRPAAFSPAPAVPGLYAPQYAEMASPYPAARPKPNQRPLVLVTIGLFVFAFTLFSLRMVRNANKAAPPPTPKISAQDRTVGMMNELLVHYNNPAFYQRGQIKNLARPVIQKYILPSRVEQVLNSLEEDLLSNPDTEMLALQASMLKQSYIANPQFRVIAQTEYRITLDVSGGEQWLILRDGRTLSRPLRQVFGRIELENIDGVWYIDDIDL